MTFATARDARTWLATVEGDLTRGELFEPRLSRRLFSEWAAEWLTPACTELLVERLREAAPATMEELSAVGAEVTADLEAELGDLKAETEAAVAFAEEECGLTVG